MRDEAESGDSPIERFADFYEEVVRIKIAIHDGRLPFYLAQREQADSFSGADLAAMVSRRLYARLARDAKTTPPDASEEEVRAYRMTRYVMAALADEIFILELDWGGKKAWLNYLLEFGLFRTSAAGRQFFVYVEQLLRTQAPTPVDVDLASIFLIALQLGFKGQYRGAHAEERLVDVRARLLKFVNTRRRETASGTAFPHAYRIPNAERGDSRIAPVSRWYWAGAIGLGAYFVISTLVWVLLWQPFLSVHGDDAPTGQAAKG